MPRRGSPKRSGAAVTMHLEEYVCDIGDEHDRLGGARFADLEHLEKLYRSIAKNLRKIARELCEIADD